MKLTQIKSSREDQAYELSKRGHEGQKRKIINTPYLDHPVDVVNLLKRWGITREEDFIVAYLHDLLEDTSITEQDIEKLFGKNVVDRVKQLSMNHSGKGMEKADWLKKIAHEADDYDVVIKLADRICNTFDWIKGKKYTKAKTYWIEAKPIVSRIKISGLDPKIKKAVLVTVLEVTDKLNTL